MIAGLEVGARADAVWVRSARPLRALASAVVGGDLDAAHHIVNMHVPNGHDCADPVRDLQSFARRLGIAEPFVCLMTAARAHEARVAWEDADGVRVGVVATVGLGTPVAAGVTPPVRWQPSTINIVVVLDAAMERATAVDGAITVTEAKVGALIAAGIESAEGLAATGTITDAVVVAWTGCGPRVPYLGPGTVAGWCLARAVRHAVGEGIPSR